MSEGPTTTSEEERLFRVPALPGAETLPDVENSARERKSRQLERDDIQNYKIRRLAAYGGLLLALVLYLAGLIAVASMLGFFGGERFAANMWHIATVVVMALFTVPTLLVLAVLRTSAKSSETKDVVIVHEYIGRAVLKFLEKLASR